MNKAQAPYPYTSINGEYLDKGFLDSVWEDLLRKAPLFELGIIEPSPSERLAYMVMTQITMRRPT